MSQEKTPLLTQLPAVFPPFHGEKGPSPPPPPAYGVLEIIHYPAATDYSKPRQPGGIASSPIVLLIALIVALVLIFGATLIIPGENNQLPATSLQHGVLQQSEPGEPYVSEDPDSKVLSIPQGWLRGFTRKSRQGRNYTAYYKVPYAEPPLGDLRFKDPVPPRSLWQGIRSIPSVAPQCIQKEKYAPVVRTLGEEDCLYANIYVPSIPPMEGLPVMVYIHGGGLAEGNASRYGPDYFMDEDVILITFEWRLGAFGFLNTGDDTIHGNMGMKDQIQMLKWVRENIRHFGGDEKRVTIFGNSGGGLCVSFLMVSPLAEGLFHRAISQSGANLCSGTQEGDMVGRDPADTVKEVGRVLNCSTSSSTKFWECLKTKEAEDIALVRTPEAVYSLSLEGRGDGTGFLEDSPYNLLQKGPNKVPYIVGVVNAEWTGQGIGIVTDLELVDRLNADFEGVGAAELEVELDGDELRKLKEFYFGGKAIGNETLRETINLMSDKGMIHCSYQSARIHSRSSATYLYVVTKPPAKSYADKSLPGFPAKDLGLVSHADELQYQFLYDGYPEIPEGDPEYFEFSRYFVKQWATFAKDGAPSSDWEPISEQADSIFWFELGDHPGRTEELRERMTFWDQFTPQQLHYAPSYLSH